MLGFPRHLSPARWRHGDDQRPASEMVPIENASMPDRTVIEWDKDDIDDLGILKVDVLALGMLTCIAKALKLVNAKCCRHPDTQRSDCFRTCRDPASLRSCTLSLAEDPAVYDMICDADTVGVFQIESRAQMTMLPRLQPASFMTW